VICEEKHMGSRAVVFVGPEGAIYTRTGRPFFDAGRTAQLLDRLRLAVDRAGLWERFQSDWLLFDAELLPWSAKAGDLLRNQYAAVGAAARAALPAAVSVLEAAAAAGRDVADLLARTEIRNANVAAYSAAYGRYCWPVDGIDGIKIAPFQLLASAGATYSDRDHGWHLAIADELCAADPQLFRPTNRLVVDTGSDSSVTQGIQWWEELTAGGGEGMVVKPLANLVRTKKGIVQPGIKCRGRDYLRIIYGPDYTEYLDRLRQRNLGHKRSMALREYALGLEGLDRFVRGEPLWRVHECVFAVLAAESEPVDPRL
jgi:protein phosphatase